MQFQKNRLANVHRFLNQPCLPWGHLLMIPLFQTAKEGVVAGLVAVSTVHSHQGMPSCCLLGHQPGNP